MNRRELLALGIDVGAAASAAAFTVREAAALPGTLPGTLPATAAPGRYAAAFAPLDRFVEQYLRDMNAPGLTLVLADETGVQRVCAYGLDDLQSHRPLETSQLFHIGSITKSMLSLCLLQLRDEGRWDLRRPVVQYLPWLRFDPATRPITGHDLLTHSAALPDGPLFPTDPAFRHRATAAPGTFFHYCNMGYEALGHLVAMLDRRPLADSLRARILAPLGMTDTQASITLDGAAAVATSYRAALNDRPYPRRGRLVASPPITQSSGAGCIASTARDMGAYVTALINRGRGPTPPLASEAGFALFCTPHMPAAEFGPGAQYGYGIAVDQIDGHARLRHTGGMLSFASALEIDLDSRVGIFLSVNSMQGYRPRPVAEYALRLMRACRDAKPLPAIPAPSPSAAIAAAADYAGTYTAESGRRLILIAEGDRLYLEHRGARVPLEADIDQDHTFTVLHADYAHFPLVFHRAGDGDPSPVVEAGWGDEWFLTPAYTGPRMFKVPAEWHRYTGHYRNEDPWIGSSRIALRAGRLWMNGTVPLEPADDGRFYLRDELWSPEWVSFAEVVNGRAMRMKLSGADLTRV